MFSENDHVYIFNQKTMNPEVIDISDAKQLNYQTTQIKYEYKLGVRINVCMKDGFVNITMKINRLEI